MAVLQSVPDSSGIELVSVTTPEPIEPGSSSDGTVAPVPSSSGAGAVATGGFAAAACCALACAVVALL